MFMVDSLDVPVVGWCPSLGGCVELGGNWKLTDGPSYEGKLGKACCVLVVISEIEWISVGDRSDVEDYNYGKILPNEFLIGNIDK